MDFFRRKDPSVTKKIAMLNMTNQLFRIYFKVMYVYVSMLVSFGDQVYLESVYSYNNYKNLQLVYLLLITVVKVIF